MSAPLAPTPFTITHVDGSTERLTIKIPTITELYQWLYLAKDQSEPAMVALGTGKDIAWIDSLDVDQFGALAAACSKIVFPLAVRMAKKGAPVAAALVAPLMQKYLLGTQVIATLSIGSGTPSDTAQPSESAEGTPAASPTPSASPGSAT